MQIGIIIFGLLIGSFLNVCILRIPKEESIIWGPSRCNSCGHYLSYKDMMPIFSYLIQRRRCRYCNDKISSQYVIIEVLTAILYTILLSYYGPSKEFVFYGIISSILLLVFVIDLKHMIIPDGLILSILIVTCTYKLADYFSYREGIGFKDSFFGLLLGFGIIMIIIIVSKGGMGLGDANLMAVLGFILGLKSTVVALFLSFIIAAIVSIFLLIFKIKGRKDPIPFGPFIIIAFYLAILIENHDILMGLYY